MKCITCGQEIPDTSTTCPYCNNKVEPIVTASEALGINNSVLPQTPNDYKLPKDQLSMTGVISTVTPENMVEQPAAPVEPVPTVTETPTVSNIPTPPPVPSVPTPPAPPVSSVAPASEALSVGTVETPAAPAPQQSYFDPTKVNLDNVDLNANANAQTLDYTQASASDRLGSTIDPKKDDGKKKSKKKVVVLAVVLLLVLAIFGGGIFVYFTQFQSTDKRIDKVVDGVFKNITAINNSKFEEGSGNYKLSYSSQKNDDNFKVDVNGKYAYNLPSKKVDLIANFTSINHNQDLIDKELNVELYLESNRAYFLMQNFKNDYVYTDIDNTYSVIKDVETRFNNPEELLLFKVINQMYDGGLDTFTKDYHKYITNISQNDINYQNINKGIRDAVKETLKSAHPTQTIDGGNNVIKINLKNPDTFKNMNKTFVNSLKNNKQAWGELTKLFGNENELYNLLMKQVDTADYKGINADIVIATDMFKDSLKYIKIPSVVDGKICYTTITPVGSGYKVVSKLEGRDIVNITYSKSTSKTSTTETKVYKLSGIIYENGVANNLNIELELVKDINPSKINVITRNSIDYQYLTQTDYTDLASKLEEFGNLGVLFKSHYIGVQTPDVNGTEEPPAEVE